MREFTKYLPLSLRGFKKSFLIAFIMGVSLSGGMLSAYAAAEEQEGERRKALVSNNAYNLMVIQTALMSSAPLDATQLESLKSQAHQNINITLLPSNVMTALGLMKVATSFIKRSGESEDHPSNAVWKPWIAKARDLGFDPSKSEERVKMRFIREAEIQLKKKGHRFTSEKNSL